MKADTFLEKSTAPALNGRADDFAIPSSLASRLWGRMAQFYCTPGQRASTINHLTDDEIAVIDKIIFTGFRNYASRVLRSRANCMNPRELLSGYLLLSPDDRAEFLKLLGEVSIASDVFRIAHYLRIEEGERYAHAIHDRMCETFYPFIFQYAQKVAKERPELSGDEFDAEVVRRASEATQEYDRTIAEREAAKLKKRRDRKPSKANVYRNKAICDLRRQDKQYWTQGRLAKRYKVTARAIRGILAKEPTWIAFAAVFEKEEQLVAPHQKRNT